MKLRNIEFGSVWCSSGSLGFYGDGYWYHKVMKPLGLDTAGSTFVSKTTTLFPRAGNMPLKEDGVTPKHLVPSCVKVRPFKGIVLNSVGLSGPGAFELIESGKWQSLLNPFMISFMSLTSSPQERLQELRGFVSFLQPRIKDFKSKFGIEINFSCPNVGLDTKELNGEVQESLDVASFLGVPIVPNFGPDVSLDVLIDASLHPACDAISVANTLKWGKMPEFVDWKGLWGSEVSPLEKLGGGGMSGKPLLPIVRRLVRDAVSLGVEKPIIAGGGILSVEDAESLWKVGARAVKLGVVSMIRPWRVRGIIQRMNQLQDKA